MSKELRIFYKRMFSSNYFSSSSFDFNETRIVLINRYVPIIIKFDTTFYICIHYDGAQTAGAQTAGAQMSSRPNGGAQTAAPKRRRQEVTYPIESIPSSGTSLEKPGNVSIQDGGQYDSENTIICIYQLLGELLASILKCYIFKLLPLRKIDTLTVKLSNSTHHLSLYLSYEHRHTYICYCGHIGHQLGTF